MIDNNSAIALGLKRHLDGEGSDVATATLDAKDWKLRAGSLRISWCSISCWPT